MRREDTRPPVRKGLWLAAAAALTGCAQTPGLNASIAQPALDHHSHVQSVLMIQAMSRACRAQPQMCPPKLPSPRTGGDLLRDLDEAGIPQSIVVSTAYLLAVPMTAGEGLDMASLVRAENEFAAEQAAVDPARLLLVVGIPLLHESAEAELAHWLNKPEVVAVKLHLTSAGFSFRNQDHVARLKWLFASAGDARKGILIHMRSSDRDYGARDVEIFLREIVPAARGQPIQIAHAGGWGGFDGRTSEAVDSFSAAARSNTLPANIWFDISGIAHPSAPKDQLRTATEKLRTLGMRRLVFGSDSGLDMTPALAWSLMRESLEFSTAEWNAIRNNRLLHAREPRHNKR